MRNFDIATWDGVREDVVLVGIFAKFTQNPAMEQYFMRNGTKCVAEANLFHPVWDIGLRADDPEDNDPSGDEGVFSR